MFDAEDDPDLEALRAGQEAQSWWEWRQLQLQLGERERYASEIGDIEDSLEEIKSQVSELLEANESLPESERLDRREFELNVEEKTRRLARGRDREADLQLELRAWQMARWRAGQELRKQARRKRGFVIEMLYLFCGT